MTKTLIVNPSWITKYCITDILLNDADWEQYITIYSSEDMTKFFESNKALSEYSSDERIQYHKKGDGGFDMSGTDAILLDGSLEYVRDWLSLLKDFKGRVVLPSTWEVYGWKSIKDVPIKETEYPAPETEFGKEKTEQERLIKESGLNWVILRYSHVFGPYGPPDVFSEMIYELLVNGHVIIKQPASRYIDFNYVTNLVPIIKEALKKPHIERQIFNVGYGGLSDREGKRAIIGEKKIENIARALVDLLGFNPPFNDHITIEDKDIEKFIGRGFHSQLDIKKAQKEFDYYPIHDQLKGLLQTATWIQSYLSNEQMQVPEITVKGKKTGSKRLEDRYNFEKRNKEEALEKGGRTIQKTGKIEE